VYAKASFGRLRAKEAREGHPLPGWPRDKPFFRRGEVGTYREEMPPEVLSSFLEEAGPVLARLGYDAAPTTYQGTIELRNNGG
jgi:hypothetical protein